MKRLARAAAAAAAFVVGVVPVLAGEWSVNYRPASLRYALHGGSLGDPQAPRTGDRKVAFELSGRAASELFDAMGPDRTDACGAQPGERFRSRDDDRLVCMRSRDGQTLCMFGFDLGSGRSIGGSIC